jgi:hypothetical protein
MSNDFDWVTALFGCSPIKMFEQLKLQLAKDIEVRNGLLSPEDRNRFDIAVFEEGSCMVFLKSGKDNRSVKFFLTEEGIDVKDGSEKLLFTATFTLDDNGDCVPRVNGEECALWQVRKMALERLFASP